MKYIISSQHGMQVLLIHWLLQSFLVIVTMCPPGMSAVQTPFSYARLVLDRLAATSHGIVCSPNGLLMAKSLEKAAPQLCKYSWQQTGLLPQHAGHNLWSTGLAHPDRVHVRVPAMLEFSRGFIQVPCPQSMSWWFGKTCHPCTGESLGPHMCIYAQGNCVLYVHLNVINA